MAKSTNFLASSNTNESYTDKTFAGLGNLIKLLPTGTVFLFQFLSPVLSNNGHCEGGGIHTVHKYLTGALVAVCGLSCFLSSFTDSYTGADGIPHYGMATARGLWPAPPPEAGVDPSAYRLRAGDLSHALLTLLVFGAVALLDSNTVGCLYPSFESSQKALLMAVPPAIGALSGVVFTVFPSKRHGVGYPPTGEGSSTQSGTDSPQL